MDFFQKNQNLTIFLFDMEEIMDKITDGEIQNGIVMRHIDLLDLNLIINPCLLSINYFNFQLMSKKKNSDERAYTKGSLPKITLINLSGYDDSFSN